MKTILESFFSWKGKFNRLQFWKYLIISSLILLILIGLLIFGVIFFYLGSQLFITWVLSFFLLLLFLLYIWTNTVIGIKRFNDLNRSGWWMITWFIPYIGIITLIYLGFFKGVEGKNNFGDDSLKKAKNTTKEEKNSDINNSSKEIEL